MLTFHAVEIDGDLTRDNPLFVGNFFDLSGMWWRKRKQRQGLILSIATGWYRLIKRNPSAPGFISEEIFITSLTKQVKDAKVILERFFDITRIGFNFNDGNKSPTLISPKKLSHEMFLAIDKLVNEVHFNPGLPPRNDKLVKSNVYLEKNVEVAVRAKLKEMDREDLLPPVNWILKQKNPITFYYEPAGSLLARDKSVWPIKAIESWPGWLRTMLFGTVVDIENAYCQFIVQKLEQKYLGKPEQLERKYPDILRMDRDKKNYRNELCRYVLQREPDDDSINVIKKLIMSLANGSNATPMLMTNGSGRSEAVRIVREATPEMSPSDMLLVGAKLSVIAKQFKAAKRDLCIFLLKSKPSRENQKKIFKMYFEWERESRYKIWEMAGQSGLHLHDGIDGVRLEHPKQFASAIFKKHNLKVSVDEPCAIS